jgi:hypothetical protein
MHRKSILLGHVVVHNTEDTLFHFAGIRTAKNDLLLGCEVNVNRVLAVDVFEGRVRAELTSVEDSEVGTILEILLNLFLGSTLQHLLHKEGVVGTS